jgi:TolB-like protein
MEKEQIAEELSFSQEEILDQVQRILKYPLFAVSGVLSSFLSYIVRETLSGRADHLKEYTIAVDVFNKPSDFKPNQNGLVRVNAGRLRVALSEYYLHCTTENVCEIIIPKGRYTPVFKSCKTMHTQPLRLRNNHSPVPGETIKIAVMPFRSGESSDPTLSIIDSIGQMLSNEFSRLPFFSVLSYYTTRQLHNANASIQDMHCKYDTQFALTGSILVNVKRITVFLQLVNAETEILIWSDRLELDIVLSENFNTAQMIASRIMSAVPVSSDFFVNTGVRESCHAEGSDSYKNVYRIVRPYPEKAYAG